MTKTFTCEHCRGTFPEEAGDDEAAEAEFASVPEWQGQPRAVICGDCWLRLMAWAKREGLPVPLNA